MKGTKTRITPTITRGPDAVGDTSVTSLVERQRQQQQKIQNEERAKRAGPPRPRSLILTQSILDSAGHDSAAPELSMIPGGVCGEEPADVQEDLNSSTTSADLIRQATQRFRLSPGPAGDKEYYFTIKQEQSGSISSISSNLRLAIKNLAMDDFTDDSALKFYSNRKGVGGGADDSVIGHGAGEGDETLIAEDTEELLSSPFSPLRGQHISVNVTQERFTSPTFRLALQVVIYPDDLPD